MRKEIAWKEKAPDGVKREVRVTFPGGDQIKWQFLRAGAEKWDYTTPPEPDHWELLLEKLENLYNRTRVPYKMLELARKVASKSAGETTTKGASDEN